MSSRMTAPMLITFLWFPIMIRIYLEGALLEFVAALDLVEFTWNKPLFLSTVDPRALCIGRVRRLMGEYPNALCSIKREETKSTQTHMLKKRRSPRLQIL